VSPGTPHSVETVRHRLDGLHWPGVLASGAVAFVLGYLTTVLVVFVGPSSTAGALPDLLVLLAFVFYSAHGIPLEVAGVGRLDWLGNAASANTPEPAVPLVIFYLIPVVVILAAAAVANYRYTSRRLDPVQTVAVVLGVAITYALLTVAGTFVFTSTSLFGGSAELVRSAAVIYGLGYPLVFGTVGAAVVGLVEATRQTASGID